jgi:hypothetical protein
MNPAAALAEMRARGVFIFLGEDVDDGRPVVRWRAAPGIVTERTVRYIRTHKEELIALLQAEAAADADRLRLAAARAFFDGESDDDAADAVPAAIAEADDAEPEPANWLGALARAGVGRCRGGRRRRAGGVAERHRQPAPAARRRVRRMEARSRARPAGG